MSNKTQAAIYPAIDKYQTTTKTFINEALSSFINNNI